MSSSKLSSTISKNSIQFIQGEADFWTVAKNRVSGYVRGSSIGLEDNCSCEQVVFDLFNKEVLIGRFVSINFEGFFLWSC